MQHTMLVWKKVAKIVCYYCDCSFGENGIVQQKIQTVYKVLYKAKYYTKRG